MERCGGRIHPPAKPPEYSPMTHKESEVLSFRVSQLEDIIKWPMRMLDLFNLQIEFKKRMGEVEMKMKENGIKMEERMVHIDS